MDEGASMIRTKGEAGTGNVVEAVRHMRAITCEIDALQSMDDAQLEAQAKAYRVPVELVAETRAAGRLPIVNFAAGGLATPADAALMMQLGTDGVFVGSGIFKSQHPERTAQAIVQAVIHFEQPDRLLEISKNLGDPMPGQEIASLETRLAERGW